MGTPLQEKLASLPPERRSRIRAETANLQAAYKTLKDLRLAQDMTQAHLAKQLGDKAVIRSLVLKNFTAFSDARLDFAKGLNVIVGEKRDGQDASA